MYENGGGWGHPGYSIFHLSTRLSPLFPDISCQSQTFSENDRRHDGGGVRPSHSQWGNPEGASRDPVADMLTKLALPCLRGAGLLHPALVPARASCACLIDVPTATALVGAAADTATTALVAAADATVSLDDLGSDIFIFLAASVLVVPASRVLNVTPVLGFLALGCGIGPYGLGLFGNSEADLQLGDLGIVFLLFIEGLQLSPDRLKKLGSFFKLGLARQLVH